MSLPGSSLVRLCAFVLGLVLVTGAPLSAEETVEGGDYETWRKTIKLPVGRVPLVEKPPEIDGQADEAWRQAAGVLRFSFIDGFGGGVAEPTTAYVLSDKENLYIFVKCAKHDPERLIARATQHDGDVWQDEAVEFFIDPQNTRDHKYFHIMVNSAGVCADVKRKNAVDADPSWNPALTVKCAKDKTGWTLEMKLPFKELGVQPGALNKIWSLNLTRSAHDPDEPDMVEDTAWSPTRARTSHKPSMFGYLWLDAGDKLNK